MSKRNIFLNKIGLITASFYIKLNGYRICQAISAEERRQSFRLRWEVYLKAGYISPSDYPSKEIQDAYENQSVIFMVCWHDKPVGTIRLTPIHSGSPVFELFNIEEKLDESSTMEIGRLAILEEHRTKSRAATFGLIWAAYTYSQQNGVHWWIGFAPHFLLRSFRPFVNYQLLKTNSVTANNLRARQQLPGYFDKYHNKLAAFKINVDEIKPWRWKKSK